MHDSDTIQTILSKLNLKRQLLLSTDNLCKQFQVILLSSADFLLKLTFSKNSFRNTIRVSNNLDPVVDQHSVGSELDPNSLEMLSADDKSHL